MISGDNLFIRRIEVFLSAEKQYGWFDIRFEGWSFWRVTRTWVYDIAVGLSVSKVKTSKYLLCKQALLATLKLGMLLFTSKRRDFLVKSFRSALRIKDGSVIRDVYYDELLDQGYSYFKLEVIDSNDFGDHSKKSLRPADLDAYLLYFWANLLARIFPVKSAISFCDEVSMVMRENGGIDVRPGPLLRRISQVHWEAKLYRWLLKRLQPSVVIVADCAEYALRLACAREDIVFVEIQHGLFDRDHPDAVPDWVEGTDDELLLPDALACYGQYWIDRLSTTRQWVNAFPAGNGLVDRYRKDRSVEGQQDVFRILVSSQGLHVEKLCSWLTIMMASAPAKLAVELTVKLHPVYDVGYQSYESLQTNYGAKVISGSAMPNIWELLSNSDLHLSISSACHFDAASLGVISIVIPLDGHELMIDSVDDQSIFLAYGPSDVWQIMSGDKCLENQTNREKYSKASFADNMEQHFRKELSIELK